MIARRRDYTLLVLFGGALALSAASAVIPGWVRFLMQVALGTGLVSLGLMVLMRAGLVSFGQGLYYCVGAYSVALIGRVWGTTDAFIAVVAGAIAATAFAAIIGLFIARYRRIFFAMLTLALSMIAYGATLKFDMLGGTDGLNIGMATFAGYRPSGDALHIAIFVFSWWTAAASAALVHLYLRSNIGRLGDAIHTNELRLEYLGLSVRSVVYINYLLAAGVAGVGGALIAITARHVDPGFAFWTTSGEFVFIVLLSGQSNVLAPFVGAGFLEFLRSFASEWAPNSWQMILGIIMLGIVLYAPEGLWSAFGRLRMRRKA